MNLFIGNFEVDKEKNSPFKIEHQNIITFIFSFLLSIFHLLGPKNIKFKYELFIIFFWMLFAWIIGKLFKVEDKIVNKPKLIFSNKKKQL